MNKFVLVFILFCSTLFAQDNILINNETKIDNFNVLVYEDKNSKLTLDEITKIDNFKTVNNHISNGFTNSTYWYKFKIKNQSNEDIKRYIKMSENILDKVDLYLLTEDNKLIKHKKSGPGYFIDGQKNKLERAHLEFTIEKDESITIYIKTSSLYPMFNSFHIYDKTQLESFEYNYTTVYAFLIGSLLSLALYNLMIFFYTKDTTYLFYVLYSICLISWQTSMSGIFPFDIFFSKESYYLIGTAIPLLIVFLSLFTNSLLDIKQQSKKYYNIINAIAIFYFILALWSIFNFKPAITLMNATASLVLPFLLYIGFLSYKKGNRIAIFYLFAQGFFLSLATLFSLSSFGFLEYNHLSRHGIMVGSFLEMILFSLALAYKIKLLEEEKLIIIQKAKNSLELRVQERTKELEESKKKLEILANKDHLSDLYNRRPLFEISNKLISLAKRDNSDISVLLFDIDKFKVINDIYGHKAGDEVIKSFAKLLKRDRRSSDIVARVGGEEFVILQPATKKEDAYKVAQEIRKKVENLEVISDDKTIKFTVSCGVDSLIKEDTRLDELIARADKKLYEAKNTGRNKVIA
ncbi:diguanylate cyclase [Halarcobacter sp.]|uniref:sensor domain-containing diguanylate cyclase n=1 Tax=Halarcobacter sp. TaxID=2321133 RepID=UPI0029F52622|nr:diguanylate cyclase [Halarcobacter sp.]